MSKSIFLFLIVIGVLYSCNSNDIMETMEPTISMNCELINPNITTLDINDANKVAKLFMQGETTKTRAVNSSSSLLETFAIKNNKEEIVMYVINDVTNGGYVVVSATKYYAPIIAYSEDQTFIVDDSLNIKVPIFEDYIGKISNVMDHPSDSLRIRYAGMWAQFEDLHSVNRFQEQTRTRAVWPTDAAIQQKKNDATSQYTSMGYQVYPILYANSVILPTAENPNRAQDFISNVAGATNPYYNWEDVDLLLVKTTTYGNNTPILQTNWGQHDVYNGTNTNNNHAGCATIALGQFLKHFRTPSTYNWNLIPNYPTFNDTEFIRFIDDVRNSLNPSYYPNRTSISSNSVENYLRLHGFNNASFVTLNSFRDMYYELVNNIPVIMMAFEQNADEGHMWVCDGFKGTVTTYDALILEVPLEYSLFHGFIDSYSYYIHMNWGWNGICNDWYYGDDYEPKVNGISSGYNFNTNKKYLKWVHD